MIVLDADGSLSRDLLVAIRCCREHFGDRFPTDLTNLEMVLRASAGLGGPPACVSLTDDDNRSMPLLLTVEDAARELGISTTTAKRLAKSGALPTVHVGNLRGRRVRRSDLVDFVENLNSDGRTA